MRPTLLQKWEAESIEPTDYIAKFLFMGVVTGLVPLADSNQATV
jgi:hypothetical protein